MKIINIKKSDYWAKYLHGSSIYNVIYSISNNYNKLIIASSHDDDFDKKLVWGTSSISSKLFSSSILDIIYDTNNLRSNKIKYIIEKDKNCLKYLRVFVIKIR